MRSIGLDLETWAKKGLLRFHSVRSMIYGLEMHLTTFHKLVEEFKPKVVVLDPVSNLIHAGNLGDAIAMLTRLVDFLKVGGITALLTSLTSRDGTLEKTEVEISSLVDTWLLLRDLESGAERNRAMYVLKSRGMAHSNQIREFLLTSHGVVLADVYVGAEGVLTGSARLSQEARERADALSRREQLEAKQRERQRKREALKTRISAMRKEFEAEDVELGNLIEQEHVREWV
jgi:circadian clock protein KaiC